MKAPKFLKKIIFYIFTKRFVAGETIGDAIRVAKELEKKNIYAIINILGERVKTEKEAIQFRDEYLRLILSLSKAGLYKTHISVKPSQLGLDISEYLYTTNEIQILEATWQYLPDALVEIDAEDHFYRDSVLKATLMLGKYFPNQRLACQINLNETLEEIRRFIEAGISMRLCKGTAYLGDIKKEKELREIFLEQAILLSEKGNRPAVATHDLYLIDKLKSNKNLEFQVLLGIENKEMEKLVPEGKKVGFYVPCGLYWWSYGKRRWKTIFKIWWRNWWYRRKKWEKEV